MMPFFLSFQSEVVLLCAFAWLGVHAASWRQAMGASEEFEVVSVADHVHPDGLNRSNLLTEFPLKVRVLGIGHRLGPWRNLHKLTLLREYVATVPRDRILFVVDLFDVIWLSCGRDLVETFFGFGRPLVFSAEFFPYPMTNASLHRIRGGYPSLHGRNSPPGTALPYVRRRHRAPGKDAQKLTYRFLNAGLFAGYAHAILRALDRMTSNYFQNDYVLRTPLAESREEADRMLVGHDDQVAWHAYALRHPDEMALDYGAELFLSVHGMDLLDFELRGEEVWARPFGRTICFAHGNGATNNAVYVRDAKQMGIQPWQCRNAVRIGEGFQMHYMRCSHLIKDMDR